MANPELLSYTLVEVESYLPSGWSLVTSAEPASWSAEDRTWRTRVSDPSDLEWLLVVAVQDAAEMGRLEALQRAVDRMVRGLRR